VTQQTVWSPARQGHPATKRVPEGRCSEVSSYRQWALYELRTLCEHFHTHTHTALHLDNINVLLPTDAQVNCLKNNFKIYIKIGIKTAPTCFGAITVIREPIIGAC
jgi:hypothetical protein